MIIFMETLSNSIKLLRPQDVLDIILILFIDFASASSPAPWAIFFALAVSLAFLLFFVHISNDISDLQTDSINLPHRPLPSGAVPLKAAKSLAVIYLCGALLMAAMAGIQFLVIVIILAAVTWTYSANKIKLSHHHFWGTMVITVCYVFAPLLMGRLGSKANPLFDQATLLLLTSLFLVTFGRILLKDYRDIAGDNVSGKITPLLKIGSRWLSKTVLACITTGTVLYVVFYFIFLPERSIVTTIFLTFIIVLLYAFLYKAVSMPQKQEKVEPYGQPKEIQIVYLLLRLWLILIVLCLWDAGSYTKFFSVRIGYPVRYNYETYK